MSATTTTTNSNQNYSKTPKSPTFRYIGSLSYPIGQFRPVIKINGFHIIIDTGVPAAYHSNTLASGAGSVSGGSMGGGFASNTMRSGMSMGGAFSSNTMQSSYNYSVKNVSCVFSEKGCVL